MNLTRTMTSLGNLYEEKVTIPSDTFEVQTKHKNKNKKGTPFTPKKSGPMEAEGIKEDVIDPKSVKKDNFFNPQNFSQKNEKTETKKINNFMNKSIFDKLYEDVMSDRLEDTEMNDAEALGLPGDGDGEMESDTEGDVTITMDRETAQKLHDLLMNVLDSGDDSSADSEMGVEDEMSEDAEEKEEGEDDDTLGEATDIKELKGKGESLQHKNNKVNDVTSRLTSKSGGDGDVTDEVSTKSTGKHAIVSDTDSGNLKGKNNKVASKTSKVGEYLAGLK